VSEARIEELKREAERIRNQTRLAAEKALEETRKIMESNNKTDSEKEKEAREQAKLAMETLKEPKQDWPVTTYLIVRQPATISHRAKGRWKRY